MMKQENIFSLIDNGPLYMLVISPVVFTMVPLFSETAVDESDTGYKDDAMQFYFFLLFSFYFIANKF